MSANKWVPMSKIAHGIAVATFTPTNNLASNSSMSSPLLRPTTSSSQSQTMSTDGSTLTTKRLSTTSSDLSCSSTTTDYAYLIPLEVGDELYIFEQLAGWYRGYVIRSFEDTAVPSNGIFPRSHVQVMDYVDLDHGGNELPNAAMATATTTIASGSDLMSLSPSPPSDAGSDTGDGSGFPFPLSASPTVSRIGGYGISSQQASMLAPTSNPFTIPTKRDRPTREYSSCPTSGIDFDITDSLAASTHLPSTSMASTSTVSSPSRTPLSTSPNSPIGNYQRQSRSQSEQQRRSPPPPAPMVRFEQTTVSGLDEPLVDEIAASLRELNHLLYTYLGNNEYSSFNLVRDHINYLYQARRQLLDQVLSREETAKLRKEIIRRMVLMNISQRRDMILLHPERGFILDIDSTSVATLYYMHWKYTIYGQVPMSALFPHTSLDTDHSSTSNPASGVSSATASPISGVHQQDSSTGYSTSSRDQQQQQQQQQPDQPKRQRHQGQHTGKRKPFYHYKGGEFHHLFFDLKACLAHICQPGEWTELQFSLYSDSQGKFVTEQFVVHIDYNGVPKDMGQVGKLQTLFLDLANQDLNNSLYLVCYIYRLGAMKTAEKEKDHISLGSHAYSIFGHHNHHHHDDTSQHDPKGHGGGYFDHRQHHPQQATPPNSHESVPLNSQSHTNLFRRPFGCATLNIGRLLQQVDQVNSGSQSTEGDLSKYEEAPVGSRSAPLYTDADKKNTPSTNLSAPLHTTGSTSYFLPAEPATSSSSGTTNSSNNSIKLQTWHYHITPGEHKMRIYTPTSESNFSSLHQYIIRDATKELTRNPRADVLCVYLRMFYGQKNNVLKTNTDWLDGTPLTARIGFPDVVFPDDERNELYITLDLGDFAHFGRTRNIQVIICARDNITGDVVETSVAVGSGTPPTSTWESAVYYHEMKPTWNERVKVKMKDVNVWQRSHLFLVVKHRSRHGGGPSSMDGINSKSGGHDHALAWKRLTVEGNTSSSDKILAMGYIPLFIPPLSHDFVADGTHTLCLYKYDKHLLCPSSYFGIVPWCSQSTAPSNIQGQESMLATILQASPQQRIQGQTPAGSNSSSLRNGACRIGGSSTNTGPTFNHSNSHHTFMSLMGLQHNQHSSYLSANSQGTGASGNESTSYRRPHLGSPSADGAHGRPHAIRDSLVVSTYLCSTRFTQNTALVQLINWRLMVIDSSSKSTTMAENNGEGVTELLSMLDKFTFVGEQEVVKFLADIFDALLDILVFRVPDSVEQQNALQDQVIVAIIWVLSIVQDRRFSNFRPVLNVYINQRFYCSEEDDGDYDGSDSDEDDGSYCMNQTDEMINNMNLYGTPTIQSPTEYFKGFEDPIYKRDADSSGTYQLYTSYRYRLKHLKKLRRYMSLEETTYNQLLKGLIRLATNPSDITKAKTLRSSIKVWEYLFRFIERSREMQRINEHRKYHDIREQLYKDDLLHFFDLATQMMHPDQPSSMIGTQTLVLQYFCEAITQVKNSYSAKEIVDIISTMMDACSHFTGKLVGFKLSMVLAFIKAPIFSDNACCCELGKKMLEWIRVWLNSYMAVAKGVIFSRTTMDGSNSNQQGDDYQPQARLPRAQWIENLRLSLTIVHEILDKVRKVRGMSMSGLSPAVMALATSETPVTAKATSRTRPVSLSSLGDDDYETMDGSNLDETEFTSDNDKCPLDELIASLIQLVPQILQTYKDIQRLTNHAIQATTAPTVSSSSNANSAPLPLAKKETHESVASSNTVIASSPPPTSGFKANSRHSLANFRDRANSTRVLPQVQEHGRPNNTIAPTTDNLRTAGVSSTFPMVLRALASSPTIPFPHVYPFQANLSDEVTELAGTDLAALVISGLMDLTVVLLDLFHLTPHSVWLTLLHNMAANKDGNGPEETADFICTLCYVCTAILFGDDIQKLAEAQGTLKGYDAFLDDPTCERRKWPKEWLNLNIVAHKIILVDILAPVTELLDLDVFLPKKRQRKDYTKKGATMTKLTAGTLIAERGNGDKMVRLWRTVYMTEVRVLASPSLEVEDLLPWSQRAVWKLADNIRGDEGTRALKRLWELTGPRRGNVPPTDQNTRARRKSSDLKMKPRLLAYFDQHQLPTTDLADNDIDSQLDLYSDDDLESFPGTDSADLLPEDVTQIHLELMPVLLKPLCAASLTLNSKLRWTTVGMIADLLAIHIPKRSDAETGQNLMIATIDKLVMTHGKGSDKIRVKWVADLRLAIQERLTTDEYRAWGQGVVDSLANLMGLLLQIRYLPADSAEFMDERINATLKLMKFVQVFERQEIYIKYVHQLVDLHLHNGNYVEAALTLRFHADLVPWDPYIEVDAIPELGYGVESAFARKQGLYDTMMAYLNKGKAWELCVDLCRELCDQFAVTVVDYKRCGALLRQRASFMEDIVTKERYYSEYFRVGFYGRGFPVSIRNQHFIYRGMTWEKMASFVERMQNRHPNAQLISGKMAASPLLPDEQIRELETGLDGQYMQVTAVTPVLNTNANPVVTNPLVHEKVKKYYQSNMVNQFTYSRLVTKEDYETTGSAAMGGSGDSGTKNSSVSEQQPDATIEPPTLSKQEMDFLNLWTEKTTFTSEDSFPAITLRSKILSIELQELSPIENAVDAMNNKTNELSTLYKTYSAYVSNPHVTCNLNPFSMALNGAVDAPVNGGVPLYKKAFLSPYYWQNNPTMRGWVDLLKKAIDEQVIVIDRCLDIHEKLVSSEMRPFHDNLVELFKKNFESDINHLQRQGTTFSSTSTTGTNTDASPKGKRNITTKSSKGSNKTNPYPPKRLSLTTSTSHPTFPTTSQSNRGSGSFFKDMDRSTLTKPRTISVSPSQQKEHPSFSSDGPASTSSTGNWPSILSHTKSSTYFSLPNLSEYHQQQEQPHYNEKNKRPSLLSTKNSDGDYFTNNSDSHQSRRSRQSSGEPSSKDQPLSLKFDTPVDGSPTKKGLSRNLRMSLRKATRRSTFSSGSANRFSQ